MRGQQVQLLSPESVLKRALLLRRVVRDIVDCYDRRRKAKERYEELLVISRKFSSFEIHETISNLRRQVTELDRDMEAYEKEIQLLDGILKDPRRGLVYFYSERDKRRIYLVWDLRQPNLLSWHELDESFADRSPVDIPEEAPASAIDSPDQ